MYLGEEFTTGAFHSNPYVSRAYGYDEGFDRFYDDLKLGQNKLLALAQRALNKFILSRGEYHARAEEINKLALSWLDSLNEDRPFFLWNHYMDVHGPYNPPDGYARWSQRVGSSKAQRLYDRLSGANLPSDDEIQLSLDLYDGEIRYIDEKIREFLDMLDSKGCLKNSLIIITSDHGDLFGEYGQYAHPRCVYPELTHVPMLISGPGVSSQTIEAPASTLDILPTILDAIGKPIDSCIGKSLLRGGKLKDSRQVFSSASSEESGTEIRRFAIQGIQRGYRLTRNLTTGNISNEISIRLPEGEEIDEEAVASPVRQDLDELRGALVRHSDRHLNTVSNEESQTTVGEVDIEERLEALGYK